MNRVCIGIPVHAEPGRLLATLASVREQTPPGVAVLLLPDGPDAATQAALATLGDLPQYGTAEARGTAACFNRLVAASDAAVLVLLESGTLVGPGWLDVLLAALEADPPNGLAGPSTNRAWNEQGVFPRAGGTLAEVSTTARDAARRFGDATRPLEPLYSLADFCYVVRREVAVAVGPADEGYGLGPCWEMDYNIRAARVGFRGVWAGASYVWRAPFTARRRRAEALRFVTSKQRYQDKFCGLRLEGWKAGYEAHCRGDACPHFAPRAIWAGLPSLPQSVIREPQAASGDPQPTILPLRGATPPQSAILPLRGAAPPQSAASAEPLVSCIMPTYNRRAFVPLAIRQFLRQDYPHSELIIVDDGTDPVADCVPADPRIRYVRLDGKLPVGAKRNRACAEARGEIIVHWDDDDWYPPGRVRAQVRALLDGPADLCGSSQVFYYAPAPDQAWRYHYQGPRRPWVAGNTLAYRKALWERSPFPSIQVAEDSRFVWGAAPKVICDLADPTLCVGLIHPTNTSAKSTSGPYWHAESRATLQALLGDDLDQYSGAARVPAPPPARLANLSPAEELPLVSCIMPTYNRPAFIALALQAFLSQDYPHKELVIVDDSPASVADLVAGVPGVRYLRVHSRLSIGGKRNLACRHAAGAIIMHWDDDDWYAPARLRYQIAPLLAGEADLTGLENTCMLELPAGVFWTTQAALHQRMFVGDVHGGTLAYWKSLIDNGLRYPEVNLAEDAALLRQAAQRGKRLCRLANPGLFVYVRHGANAWRFTPGQFLDPAGWQRIAPPATFPAATLAAYQQITRRPVAV